MRVTILYDNDAWDGRLTPGWGFSCLVEAWGRRILFDAGGDGRVLLGNMEALGLDPKDMDWAFVSHGHFDHVGGLPQILDLNPITVYVPSSCPLPRPEKGVVRVSGPLEIEANIYSTGELDGIEQALVVQQGEGVVVIVGCSHPGVEAVLKAASRFGPATGLIGGLHGFDDFILLESLDRVCPTHCTRFKKEIKRAFPGKTIEGGAGRVIEV
jgi:7,8-dihydropterin-6-yl-methyl-4-(beta-D-ribofuranosyl)aminobenzene 5'-phosphate synthase